MDKLQQRDTEGGPEKDGEMNFEDCAASFRLVCTVCGLCTVAEEIMFRQSSFAVGSKFVQS